MTRFAVVVSVSTALALQGCASTYSQLASAESSCPDTSSADERLQCALAIADGDSRRDTQFRSQVRAIGQDLLAGEFDDAEAHRRLDVVIAQFQQEERAANQRNAALAVVGIAAIGAAAAIANNSDGAGYTPAPSYSAATDYSWDWDAIRGPYGSIQWRCRGVQTGRFAPDYRCAGLIRNDDRWPG